jgi:hypothetical protein
VRSEPKAYYRRYLIPIGLLGLMALLSSCALQSPPGSPQDAATTQHVSQALRTSGAASGGLHVSTTEGVVTVWGFVDDSAQRIRVSKVISNVDGVRAVRDRLTLMPGKGNPNPPQGASPPE